MKAFLCANCFKYQLTPPKPACALKSALEVSLWTLPKWPKTGGPPAEPSVWKWVDTLPRKDVTIQIRKLFTSNFIRQIYQNLIYHDLSSIHIYSWNWPPKKCATLILLQKSHRHFPYVPQVLCTEESSLEPGSRWEILQLPTTNPASGWKSMAIRPPALEERPPFWPKETPIKETGGTQKDKKLKSCIRGPKHQRTIYYEISALISPKKNALVVGLSCISDSCWSTYGWFTLIADASAMSCGVLRPEPRRLKSIEHGTSKVGSQ